ncbi:dynamin family protein [Metasolibacillus meyeri]|uniref:dynamin family protein n=1 Tax=Metasolibacillus meyeri TaxID=1071052 RepID=UPI00187D62D4|nr:dynamin family protein [Metasolibacillus meyeri]
MNLIDNMDLIKTIIEKTENDSLMTMFYLLQERVDYPESFVTMLGETSSGKSSIINGLLGEQIIYTAAQPTTGTVIELYEYDVDPTITPYAVMKNATLRKLTENEFYTQCLEPSDDVLRLRLNVPKMPHQLQGMRLFDTPGYGSIHDKHEEVLKEFIPNSDVLIYVVNYRVGIGEADAEFLRFIANYMQDDVKFFLVINRAPANITNDNVRITEIVKYAKDLLHEDIPYFIIEGIPGDGVKLPQSEALWTAVRKEVQSPARQQRVNEALFNFQLQLLEEAELLWQKRVSIYETTDEEKALIQKEIDILKVKKVEAQKLINDTFKKMTNQLPILFKKANFNMYNNIEQEIIDTNKWNSAEECTGYVKAHLIPRYEKLERKKIMDYLEQEINILNEKLEELVNAAIVNFTRQIEIISNHFEPVVEGISRKIASRTTDNILRTFLARYGGRGGAGAGVANLAKKSLKTVGKWFGKTFTREQHNALASFLKRIGATSTRNLSIAATVFIDIVFYVIEVHRWKGRLLKDVNKSLTKWEEDTLRDVLVDVEELREVNLQSINEYFDDFLTVLDSNKDLLSDNELTTVRENLREVAAVKNKLMKEGVNV